MAKGFSITNDSPIDVSKVVWDSPQASQVPIDVSKVVWDKPAYTPQELKGGANSPALQQARANVQKLTKQNQNLDLQVAPIKAAYNFTWPVSAGLNALINKGSPVPQPITGGGKALSDLAMLANPATQEALNLAGKGIGMAGKAIAQAPNNILRGGLPKEEVTRLETEYGKDAGTMLGNLAEKVKTVIGNKWNDAQKAYATAVNSFKENQINSQPFYQAIQKGLRNKGWIDLQGNPTSRYKAGLDPVYDKLTGLYEDLRGTTTGSGKRISGKVMSKEDFSTYRDALGSMLREKPSDSLVMSARNALYNSAEKSGMTGIKAARDLEHQAFRAQDRFLTSNGDLKFNENTYARIGRPKGLTKDQIRHIKELENYTGKPILSESSKINALKKAREMHQRALKFGAASLGFEGAHKVLTGKF